MKKSTIDEAIKASRRATSAVQSGVPNNVFQRVGMDAANTAAIKHMLAASTGIESGECQECGRDFFIHRNINPGTGSCAVCLAVPKPVPMPQIHEITK